MTDQSLVLGNPKHKLYARQFETGARKAAELKGITVIIDVFRASNTMLELLDAGAIVKPVTTVKEALTLSEEFIKVGESEGDLIDGFDFDNSPYTINKMKQQFKGKKVVIRTTNGTRGILAALGSDQIIVGTYRNFSAVVNYCYEAILKQVPVTFVGMGTLEEERIEDTYCAKMFVISLLEKLQEDDTITKFSEEGNNPWRGEWQEEIMNIRGGNHEKKNDYLLSLELNKVDIIPVFNPKTGFLELVA